MTDKAFPILTLSPEESTRLAELRSRGVGTLTDAEITEHDLLYARKEMIASATEAFERANDAFQELIAIYRDTNEEAKPE